MNSPPTDITRKFKTYLLTGVLLFFFLSVFTAGYLFKHGISIESFTLGRTTISGFVLQWQDKLHLQINSIVFRQHKEQSKSSIHLKTIGLTVEAIQKFGNLFTQISVEKITIGNLTGSFHFKRDTDDSPAILTLTSTLLDIHAELTIAQKSLVIDIIQATSERFNSFATGHIRLQNKQEILSGSLSANLGGSIPVTLNFTADENGLSFQGKGAGRIGTITPFVDLFGLNHTIQRWITGNLKGSHYTLNTFGGMIPWRNPASVVDTLYVEGVINNGEYTFAPNLSPLKTPKTDLIFSKNILTISPHDATLYDHELEQSWLNIDFNDPTNIILTIHIKTQAVVDDDILMLLNYYNIPLPLKQTGGKTATVLTLTINLNQQQVTTSATLTIDKGTFEYNTKNYGVTNTQIIVDNSTITLNGTIGFNELFTANVSGSVDTKNNSGELNFSVTQLTFQVGESTLHLDTPKENLQVLFQLQPEKYLLNISQSSWNLDDVKINLGSFSSPFSPKNLSMVLPSTQLTIPSGLTANISGSFSIDNKQASFQCDLLQYDIGNIQLQEPTVSFSIQYDNELLIQTLSPSLWKINNILTTLHPTNFTYNNNIFSIIDGRISYGHFFDSHISGHYNQRTQHGDFLLENLHIKEKNIGFLFGTNNILSLQVHRNEKGRVITVPDLDLEISTGTDKSWSAAFRDLSVIYPRSSMLQQLGFKNGSVNISSKNGKIPYFFSADIPNYYSFLINDNTPINHLDISGTITEQGLKATVNKKLHILYTNKLIITSKNLKFNIPEIVRFVKEQASSKTSAAKEKMTPLFTLDARNSGLFLSPKSQMLADRLQFKHTEKATTAQLEHESGNITFTLSEDIFSLHGKNLNDTFMGSLIKGAHFKNGQMSLAAKGSFDTFSVLFKIEDTHLTKFNTLNNILVFLNTIPALITFSLPEFTTKGLPINSIVAGMVVNKGLATVESLILDSPEIKITGSGLINFPAKNIEMDLNVTTRAKENLNKIPLIGYVLVGTDRRASMTIAISGDLQNPEVKSSVLKDVATLPFNILFRTLALPLHLIHSMTDSNQDQKTAPEEQQ